MSQKLVKCYGDLKDIEHIHGRLSSVVEVLEMHSNFDPLIKVCGAWKVTNCYLLRGLIERF